MFLWCENMRQLGRNPREKTLSYWSAGLDDKFSFEAIKSNAVNHRTSGVIARDVTYKEIRKIFFLFPF